LLEARVIIASYNDHVGSFLPEPFWLVRATKFTRAWEPALLWNQFDSLTVRRRPSQFRQCLPVSRMRTASANTDGKRHT